MLLNERIDAARAVELGLATRVVADDASTQAGAAAKAAGPTDAHGAIKRLLRDSATRGLREQLTEEARVIAERASAPNGREGVAAFLEKRVPSLTHERNGPHPP